MATHDYVIDNSTGANVRSDLNNVLQAILTNNSSGSAPSTTAAYMLWADTSNNILKMRNSADNAWINLFTLSGGVDVDAASNFASTVTFFDDVSFDGATAGRDIQFDRSDNALEFLDNAKAVTPIKAINKKEETIFLGPCLSSKYPSGICIEPKPKKYPPAKSPRSAAWRLNSDVNTGERVAVIALRRVDKK